MSLYREQTRALATTRDLLYDLLAPKQRPKTVKELKLRVHQALRHFPPLRENGEPMFSQDNFSK